MDSFLVANSSIQEKGKIIACFFPPTFWISSTDLTRRQLKQKLKISSLLCCAFNFGFGYALLLLTRFTEDSNCKVLGELLVKMVKMVLQKTFKGAWKRNNKNHMILWEEILAYDKSKDNALMEVQIYTFNCWAHSILWYCTNDIVSISKTCFSVYLQFIKSFSWRSTTLFDMAWQYYYFKITIYIVFFPQTFVKFVTKKPVYLTFFRICLHERATLEFSKILRPKNWHLLREIKTFAILAKFHLKMSAKNIVSSQRYGQRKVLVVNYVQAWALICQPSH